MIWVFGIITLAYVLTMLYFLFGLTKVPEQAGLDAEESSSFSVIVPFRNESENLPRLLKHLGQLAYPKTHFEIFLVNDASEDSSLDICHTFRSSRPDLDITILDSARKSNSPKKDALDTAIKKAKFTNILTTDADCEVPETWLQAYNSFFQEQEHAMASGPVVIKDDPGFLSRFQVLDLMSLQAVTIGSFGMNTPLMCNGANLCFRKKEFLMVNGYTGNDHIASGDDVFLLEKFEAAGLKTCFLRNRAAIVTTVAQPNLSSIFSQRLRWATKTSSYRNVFPKAVGALVLFMNFLLVGAAILLLFGIGVSEYLLLSFLIKFNIDFILIFRMSVFFERENCIKHYYWISFLYPFFAITVGLFSLIPGYKWKGRKFRK